MESITHKQLKQDLGMPLKQDLGMPPQPRNNNIQSTSVTRKLPEPENRELPVKVSSKSNSEEFCYFTDAVESSDNPLEINSQSEEEEDLTGDLSVMSYQARFVKELYGTNILNIKCISSFINLLLESRDCSRGSNCKMKKQSDIIKILGFANKYSLSNEGGKVLLEIINSIYVRNDILTALFPVH